MKEIIPISVAVPDRSCGDCTACCEGWLGGVAHGQPFFRGRCCSYKAEKGCSIYELRPHDPCVTYNCIWLQNKEIPYWLKPSISKVIMSPRVTKSGIEYLEVVETDEVMSSRVLSWLIQYAMRNTLNLSYTVEYEYNYIGSKSFIEEVESK